MAKRVREEESQPASQCVMEERHNKRHAAADAWRLPENWQHGAGAGWDLLPAGKQQARLSAGHHPPAAEPLRPTNQADSAAAAAAAAASQVSHLQQQQQQAQQHPHAAVAAAAAAELGLSSDLSSSVDWQVPEQVAALLRALHLERLRRQGQQLPEEYQQQQQQYQQQQQPHQQ